MKWGKMECHQKEAYLRQKLKRTNLLTSRDFVLQLLCVLKKQLAASMTPRTADA